MTADERSGWLERMVVALESIAYSLHAEAQPQDVQEVQQPNPLRTMDD